MSALYDRLIDAAARHGFNGTALRQHLRTACAVCLAVVAAWLLGLQHPQWAGMTVWAASQPLRGQMLEKSLFRVTGTVVGAAVGVGLVLLARGDLLWLVTGLALWLGLCAGLGNLLRSFASYGAMLAGYTAAMVALLDTGHPEQAYSLGWDRLFTALTGVFAALLVGWLFTPAGTGIAGADKIRLLLAQLLRDIARAAQGPHAPALGSRQLAERLSAMAAIEESLDLHGAGSPRAHEAVRALRRLIYAQVSALLWLRGATPFTPAEPVQARRMAEALEQAAHELETQPHPAQAAAALGRARDAAAGLGNAPEVLGNLDIALQAHLLSLRHAALPSDHRAHQLPVVLHSDWLGARRAMLRAFGAIFLAGMVWVGTGWSGGAYMLLGLSVMITVFSSFENPARAMRFVTLGQAMGVAIALACQWLLWPMAHSQWQMVLMMLPCIFIGALVFSHRRTMPSGYDCNMALLLLLSPQYPHGGSFWHSVSMGAAVLTGPLAGWVAYRFILPVTVQGRLQGLRAMMVHELQDMAAAGVHARDRRVWRARLFHRLLRLVRVSEKAGPQAAQEAAECGLAALRVGVAILALHTLADDAALGVSASRRIRTALLRLQHLQDRPAKGAPSLRAAALRAEGRHPEAARQLRQAAADLEARGDFFASRA